MLQNKDKDSTGPALKAFKNKKKVVAEASRAKKVTEQKPGTANGDGPILDINGNCDAIIVPFEGPGGIGEHSKPVRRERPLPPEDNDVDEIIEELFVPVSHASPTVSPILQPTPISKAQAAGIQNFYDQINNPWKEDGIEGPGRAAALYRDREGFPMASQYYYNEPVFDPPWNTAINSSRIKKHFNTWSAQQPFFWTDDKNEHHVYRYQQMIPPVVTLNNNTPLPEMNFVYRDGEPWTTMMMPRKRNPTLGFNSHPSAYHPQELTTPPQERIVPDIPQALRTPDYSLDPSSAGDERFNFQADMTMFQGQGI